MRVAADRMTVKAVKANKHSLSSTMAANFHSDSIFAVSASALILSAITVISSLMLASSSVRDSSPPRDNLSDSVSSSSGDNSGPYPGLSGDSGHGSGPRSLPTPVYVNISDKCVNMNQCLPCRERSTCQSRAMQHTWQQEEVA